MHLTNFMAAYNFARRLRTLGGLTPYEYICKIWTSEPDRLILKAIHKMPGLNNRPWLSQMTCSLVFMPPVLRETVPRTVS